MESHFPSPCTSIIVALREHEITVIISRVYTDTACTHASRRHVLHRRQQWISRRYIQHFLVPTVLYTKLLRGAGSVTCRTFARFYSRPRRTRLLGIVNSCRAWSSKIYTDAYLNAKLSEPCHSENRNPVKVVPTNEKSCKFWSLAKLSDLNYKVFLSLIN